MNKYNIEIKETLSHICQIEANSLREAILKVKHKYHNGDIVLVNFEPVESGDIALITMDGYGYIKKIGDQELLPLNPKYDPIPMDESVRVNGKIIGVFDPSWYI